MRAVIMLSLGIATLCTSGCGITREMWRDKAHHDWLASVAYSDDKSSVVLDGLGDDYHTPSDPMWAEILAHDPQTIRIEHGHGVQQGKLLSYDLLISISSRDAVYHVRGIADIDSDQASTPVRLSRDGTRIEIREEDSAALFVGKVAVTPVTVGLDAAGYAATTALAVALSPIWVPTLMNYFTI
ncbi:MAG: hypothetical protein PF961_00370 [Planctomycetota bacterium]|jgi:hypothetical protein|nr:hypothetical protein [Planctomycetota bacterium]